VYTISYYRLHTDMVFTRPPKPRPRAPEYKENVDLREIVDIHLRINRLYTKQNLDFSFVSAQMSQRIEDFESSKNMMYDDFNLQLLIRSNSQLWVRLRSRVNQYHATVMNFVNQNDPNVLSCIQMYPPMDTDEYLSRESQVYHLNNAEKIENMHQNNIAFAREAIRIDKLLWQTVKESGTIDMRAVRCANTFDFTVYPITNLHMNPNEIFISDGENYNVRELISKYEQILKQLESSGIKCHDDVMKKKSFTSFLILQAQMQEQLSVPYSTFVQNIAETIEIVRNHLIHMDVLSRQRAASAEPTWAFQMEQRDVGIFGDDYDYSNHYSSSGGAYKF